MCLVDGRYGSSPLALGARSPTGGWGPGTDAAHRGGPRRRSTRGDSNAGAAYHRHSFLPENESILDFVVGDSEYWHLTGAANVAFLKPIATGVETNVALICESGRIYSFLASEGGEPHLVVRIEPPPRTTPSYRQSPTLPPSLPVPKSPPISSWRNRPRRRHAMPRSRPTPWPPRPAAEARAVVEDFRADYPRGCTLFTPVGSCTGSLPSMSKPCGTTASSPISAHTPRNHRPFMKPSTATRPWWPMTSPEDGLYIVRRILDSGWLQIGKRRQTGRYKPERLVMSVWKKIPIAPGGVMPGAWSPRSVLRPYPCSWPPRC